MKRVLTVVLVLICTLYAALVGLALISDRLIFQPQPSSYADEGLSANLSRLPEPGHFMHIISGGERISALYLPNSKARFTLLFSHGNAEDIGDDLPLMQLFREAGFSVFAYDYRGYGTSTGRPSEKAVYEDAEAAYDFLTRKLGVSPDHVIAMGRSVGCAPAIHLAANRPVRALIAEAPFTSAFRVLTRVPLLPWDKFNNVRTIRKVHVPVLIIHGRNDEVISFWHGEKVFRAANEPKRFVPIERARHNDVMFVAGPMYFQVLADFANQWK
ncbi:MAG TPA: alpha/beta hydrolase [Terriglobales bacterium]|nr:alpha/beta hydrolase [Terriglobales bacterium]